MSEQDIYKLVPKMSWYLKTTPDSRDKDTIFYEK